MDAVLSYDFGEIDASIRQEIHTTSARLSAALEDLRARIAPLQHVWTAEAAAAYQVEQDRWAQSATALHDILVRLGAAVGDGTADIADADRRAAGSWA